MNISEKTDYYPAPFWFINHRLEKREIRRQLRLMKGQHINSFFIHPRAGLLIPYGSTEFFRAIRYIVEEAEKLGMNPGIYDEDPYPSGAAGGRVIIEHPEFAARGLVFRELKVDEDGRAAGDIGRGKLLEAVAVRIDRKGNVLESVDVSGDVGVLRREFFRSVWKNSYYVHLAGAKDYLHYRAETYYPTLALDIRVRKGWRVYATVAETVKTDDKYGCLPDNLNPDCVSEFIRRTHERYKEFLGDKFGSVIKTIFTDETATGAAYPWTPGLESEIRKRRKLELKGSYFRIFRGGTERDRILREAYWKTVQDLFIESFYKPVSKWCRQNQLRLCGHGISEEDPLSTANGMNIFSLQKYMGIPGFDHITSNIPDGKEVKSLNLGGRLVASAAAQQGKKIVQSECFGCNAYNFNQSGMKKTAHWLFALGVNQLVPHGFHYSYDGFRKDDAGKSFFFQDPEFENFSKFADYFGRLGYKLGMARSAASVCIMYPASSFRRLMPAERELAENLREELYDCVQFMFNNHIQFELADETALAASNLENGMLRCGKCLYSTVVTPFKELGPGCMEVLEKLRRAGMELLFFPEDKSSLIGRDGFKIESLSSDAPASSLMVLMKETVKGKLIYVYNNREYSGYFELEISGSTGKHAYIYDAAEDRRFRLQGDGGGVFKFDIKGYGAKLIEISDKNLDAGNYKCPVELDPPFKPVYEENPQWDYIPPVRGLKAVLRDWDVRINGKMYGRSRYCLMRDVFGTELRHLESMAPRPAFDTAPLKRPVFPLNASFSACFRLNSTAGVKLIGESETFAGECSVHLNGHEIELSLFKRARHYDPWNLELDIEKYCKRGRNDIRIKWEKAGEFSGLRSLLYIKES